MPGLLEDYEPRVRDAMGTILAGRYRRYPVVSADSDRRGAGDAAELIRQVNAGQVYGECVVVRRVGVDPGVEALVCLGRIVLAVVQRQGRVPAGLEVVGAVQLVGEAAVEHLHVDDRAVGTLRAIARL